MDIGGLLSITFELVSARRDPGDYFDGITLDVAARNDIIFANGFA